MDNLSKKDCKKWKKNKLKNPKTKRSIQKNKVTYNKIKKVCKPKKLLSDKKICKKWGKNKLKNPVTKRKIKHYGPTYKKLQKKCIKPNKIILGKELKLIKKEIKNTRYENRFKMLMENKKYYKDSYILFYQDGVSNINDININQIKLLNKHFKKLRVKIHPDRFGNLVNKYPEFKNYVNNAFNNINRFHLASENFIHMMS